MTNKRVRMNQPTSSSWLSNHYYKMWVQFINPYLVDQWIHCFFTGPHSLQPVNSLKTQWNHLAYRDTFCCSEWNGMESLQQDTKMQIDNKVKTITKMLTIEKRTLIKSIRIFKGAPRVETLSIHQCLVLKIARPITFCFQPKFKNQKEDNWGCRTLEDQK